MKRILKKIIALTPYRVVRNKRENRFQAIDDALIDMKERGFCPKVVIDGGAHLGTFSIMAKRLFPDAIFHLIEPQAACLPHLRALCITHNFSLHECALADMSGTLSLCDADEPSTGAHIDLEHGAVSRPVRAVALDDLLRDKLVLGPVLLKLDLQGFELHALRGAIETLRNIDVILTEVSFYAQAYEPSIAELVQFFDAHNFELYDIAAIAGRSRDNRAHQGDFIFAKKGSQLVSDRRWN
jgi:FkbM family methyltransferase